MSALARDPDGCAHAPHRRPAKHFKIHFKKRRDASSWTFSLSRHFVRVENDANGTRLYLPPTSFGREPYVLAQRLDVGADGLLLADVRFRRDTRGRWFVVAQRESLAPREAVPLEKRRVAFLDPGSRAGQTAYLPDGGETIAFLEGGGGADKLMDIAERVDAIVKKTREVAKAPANTADERRRRRRRLNKLKHSEFKLRDRAHDLMKTARHTSRYAPSRLPGSARSRACDCQIAHDLFARADTVVVPIFETSRMVKRAKAPGDRIRKINSKTARSLLSLRHAAFRHRLHHVANTLGKECVNESEEYTTVGCPSCLYVNAGFSGTTFRCARCSYCAPRDAKSGLTLAVKCLDAEWRSRL